MISPYLKREAEKLGISSKAEYRREDYVTPRVRPDRLTRDLETTDLPVPWSKLLLQAAGFIVVLLCGWEVVALAAPWIAAWRVALVP